MSRIAASPLSAVLPAAVIAVTLAACGGTGSTPEDAVRAWLAAAEAAVEAKDRGAALDLVGDDFMDNRGNDKTGIGKLLRLYFLRQQNVELLVHIDNIAVSGDSAAQVQLTVGMAGSGSGTFGFSADAQRFELELEAHGGDWFLIGARWADVGGTLH